MRSSPVVAALSMLALCVLVACGEKPAGADGGAGGGSEGGGSGGGGGAGGGSAASDPSIATESLGAGRVGTAYSQPLAATGGVPPYGWNIANRDPALTWLHVDATSGVLSGLPDTAATTGASLTVAVTDQQAKTATRQFMVTVVACTSGEMVACVSSDGTQCTVGQQACVNGELSGTCQGALSDDVARCGANCTSCGAASDRCTAGACACGSGAPCAAGQACCGGTCKNLDDPATCGSCTNDCTSQAGVHAAGSCVSQQCVFMCVAPFQNCAVGSVPRDGCPIDLSSDRANCGSCGHECTVSAPTTVVDGGCAAGACWVACASNALNCNTAPEDGCEQPVDPQHCGSCTAACTAAGTAHVQTPQCVATGSAWACQPVCVSGWGNCDGIDSNGCEVDLNTSFGRCGSCTHACDPMKADNCAAGQCRCGSNASCGSGLRCVGGACICDTQSGCSGCCSGGTTCVAGTSLTACGSGGSACANCSNQPAGCGVKVCDTAVTPHQCDCL